MAGYQPARGGARRETIQEFMERRAREVASFGRAAEAAAYAGVKNAIRAGQDYRLMTPGEVMALRGGLGPEQAGSGGAPSGQAKRAGNCEAIPAGR